MYAIRVDNSVAILRVELSGRVTTAEALRAASQAYTLAEAGNIAAVECDLAAVRRGPGGLLVIATALAAGFRTGMRIAFVGTPGQCRIAGRIARFSGMKDGIRTFETQEGAAAWLSPALPAAAQSAGTARRHLDARTQVQPAAERKAASRASRSANPAA